MVDIALIAPVRAYRDALAAALASDSEFRIVAHATSFVDAVSSVRSRYPPVTLIDFAVDDFIWGLDAVHRTAPGTLLVGIGIEPRRAHSELVIRAAEAGLTGFLDADQPIEDIVQAVRLALKGESLCSPRIAALLLAAMQRHPDPSRIPGSRSAITALTPREAIVAELIGLGLTNRQIASRLIVGESTVKSHVHSILMKLGVAHRTDILIAGSAGGDSGRP
jgi:two-component system, NarL family, nitrate/nitrite response regulator NarL